MLQKVTFFIDINHNFNAMHTKYDKTHTICYKRNIKVPSLVLQIIHGFILIYLFSPSWVHLLFCFKCEVASWKSLK